MHVTPDGRSDIREAAGPACRFAHAGYVSHLICPSGTARKTSSIPSRKNISIFRNSKSCHTSLIPFRAEGRFASVTKREAECGWLRLASLGEAMFGSGFAGLWLLRV